MSDIITVTGVVATPPRVSTVAGDLKITSFRLASGQRRFDKGRNRWVDANTNWYTVTTFRQLAVNVGHSVLKGDRVVATGRLRIKEWTNDGRTGTTIDVEADAVGHDLTWGTTAFTRVAMTAAAPVQEAVEAPVAEAGFGTLAGGVWSTPLAPVAFDAGDGGLAGGGYGTGYGSGYGTGYGTDESEGQGVGARDGEERDDDERDDSEREELDDGSVPTHPTFIAADATPF